jgi:hypothetical protein
MTKILSGNSHSLFLRIKDKNSSTPFPTILSQEDDHHDTVYMWQNDDSTKNQYTKLCVSNCCVIFFLCCTFFSLIFTTFCPFLIINVHSFYALIYIAHAFVYWIWINASHITFFNFWKYIWTSRLGGGLTIFSITIGQGLDMWNTQL